MATLQTINMEDYFPEDATKPAATEDELQEIKRDYPYFYKVLREADAERISYKENEYAYRRHMEKTIITDMLKKIPKSLDLELSVLYKAKSFVSGDFCYAAKYINEKFLIWIGDSISHGTGSSIVKNIINDTVDNVFTLFRTKKEYSLKAFVQRVQREFSSPKVVKRITEADLSDIITDNDINSKMSIVIPTLFLQMEKCDIDTRIRICNRGMPLTIIIRPSQDNRTIEKCIIYANQETISYEGAYKDIIEINDHSGVPLILDRELFKGYVQRQLTAKTAENTQENEQEFIFEISEFIAKKGDLIVIPSDGVTEMRNEAGDEYGLTNLIDELIQNITHNEKYNKKLSTFKEDYYLKTLRKFTFWNESFPITGNGIEDDMTMFFIRIK